MVYTQQEASLGPDYRQALERLSAAAAGRGPVGGGRFRDLPLMLTPVSAAAAATEAGAGGTGAGAGAGDGLPSEGARHSQLGGCRADSAAGLLRAPVGVTAEELYAAVEQLGGQVLGAAAARHRREAELAALRQQVERKVMLR